ncbi:MAG TPA: 4Fe-4S binding protein [Candidatus Omnitrophota bacterium]|nr:4Fe-4S binding protein [Candidatus Omnitrophota bacterium]HPS20952.1 4Fe-4S binding protein [Candidatus Omnitrophota bacterium]
MNVDSVGLVYFSPTQTTIKVLNAIAQGSRIPVLERFDLTPSNAITRQYHELTNDLAIIGAPVYAGRLPSVMVSRFQRIKGNGRPAIIVVVYGNRAYEDALIELRDVSLEAGFRPIAAGAFIGEHSYSTSDLPIAVDRPDTEDVIKARAFGEAVRQKMMDSNSVLKGLQVPGNMPYKEVQTFSGIVPSVSEGDCTKCGICVRICPTGAIDEKNPANVSQDLCIRCCACIKKCPKNARRFDNPKIKQVTQWLYQNFSARKEPEIYL